MSGTLTFKPLRGALSRDNETFGTMDLYLVLEVDGGMKQRSKTLDDGGTKPDFSKLGVGYSFYVTDQHQLLQVQVWNEYTLKSDKQVGQGATGI